MRELIDPVLSATARAVGTDVLAALDLGRRLGVEHAADLPGDATGRLTLLASLGHGDLTCARVVEPHLDALSIRAEAGQAGDDASRGVWAAHAPGHRLSATPEAGGWVLTGSKPWCSLADVLDRAVVTATGPDGHGRAFDVDLGHPGVSRGDEPWPSRGLAAVRSGSTRYDAVPAEPVGGPGFYLDRPGFAWGGIGVAAVWFGGARALADRLVASLVSAAPRRTPDQIAHLHVGRVDEVLHGAGLVLLDAAARIERGEATGEDGRLLALRVRGAVARGVETVIEVVGHALGPGPLTGDEEHARRVADLTVYVRQHHAERDTARLGEAVLAGGCVA